jgi:hypothetical protein
MLATANVTSEPAFGQIVARADALGRSARPPAAGGLRGLLFLAVLLPALLTGCKAVNPSNFRTWAPDQSQLAWAEFQGDQVTVHNVRNCSYVTQDHYAVNQYDKTFDLNTINSVDFVMVPFVDMPSIAHTMLSFGFDTGERVVVSVEIRKEDGEAYNPVKGFFRQYELMYVVADERDIIQLSAIHRDEDVYVYRAKADRKQCRALFVDMLQRANKLIDEPEFYHTVTNNCTTNIRGHVNRIAPGRIPYDVGVLLPGLSDRYAFNLGLIDTNLPYEKARERANISKLARQYKDHADFSQKIRL